MRQNGNGFGHVMADIVEMIVDPAQFRERFERVKEELERARANYAAEQNKILEKVDTGEFDRVIEAETNGNAKVKDARAEMENAKDAYKNASLNPDISPAEKMRLWEALKDAKDAHYQAHHQAEEDALERMRAPMTRAKADVERLGTEFMQMRPAYHFLKFEERLTTLESRTEGLETYKSRTDHLWGSDLEMSMPKKIVGRLPRWNLGRHEFLLSAFHGMDPDFMDDLIKALDEKRVSEEEYERICNTDVILKATALNGAKEEVWVALEVSATINDDDIERAGKSADILKRIQKKRALALVAGYSIADPQTEKAEQEGIEVLLIK